MKCKKKKIFHSIYRSDAIIMDRCYNWKLKGSRVVWLFLKIIIQVIRCIFSKNEFIYFDRIYLKKKSAFYCKIDFVANKKTVIEKLNFPRFIEYLFKSYSDVKGTAIKKEEKLNEKNTNIV